MYLVITSVTICLDNYWPRVRIRLAAKKFLVLFYTIYLFLDEKYPQTIRLPTVVLYKVIRLIAISNFICYHTIYGLWFYVITCCIMCDGLTVHLYLRTIMYDGHKTVRVAAYLIYFSLHCLDLECWYCVLLFIKDF